MNVTVGRYLLGVASLAIVVASTCFTATAARRRFFAGWIGSRARLAEAAIGLATLITTLELLGAVGLFRLVPITAASALIAVLTNRAFGGARGRGAAGPGDPIRPAGSTRITTAIAVAATATVTAEWLIPTLSSYDTG